MTPAEGLKCPACGAAPTPGNPLGDKLPATSACGDCGALLARVIDSHGGVHYVAWDPGTDAAGEAIERAQSRRPCLRCRCWVTPPATHCEPCQKALALGDGPAAFQRCASVVSNGNRCQRAAGHVVSATSLHFYRWDDADGEPCEEAWMYGVGEGPVVETITITQRVCGDCNVFIEPPAIYCEKCLRRKDRNREAASGRPAPRPEPAEPWSPPGTPVKPGAVVEIDTNTADARLAIVTRVEPSHAATYAVVREPTGFGFRIGCFALSRLTVMALPENVVAELRRIVKLDGEGVVPA